MSNPNNQPNVNPDTVTYGEIWDKVNSSSGKDWSYKDEADATGQSSRSVSETAHFVRDDRTDAGLEPERMFSKEDKQDGGDGAGLFSFFSGLFK